ncbi:MAG: ATP-dependent metallopeptidase FtsH/Yme1/Tma family protein [Bradymonadaceae bacterium]|nr:ATP-dependent metallopeptidase FtsH/Yme1/Tma family protein [Lujinxingiaceae bacterium]
MEDFQKRTPPSDTPAGTQQAGSPFNRRTIWFLVFVILGTLLAVSYFQTPVGVETIAYSELKDQVRAGQVESVVLSEASIVATPTQEALERVRLESEDDAFTAWQSARVRADETFIPLLESRGVTYEALPEAGCAAAGGMMWIWMLPMLMLFLFWSFLLRRMNMANAGGGAGGANSPVMSFGKSRAKLYAEPGTGVTFEDVAGVDEAKEELREIIDFLREPHKFTRLGGKVPKGVLLVGPPGTGKTLLARAVAGEAEVPFFNLSGSDFVEMFVGVGAARVRDLFQQAQDNAPCIIFVDELDAIGKTRGGGGFQGNEEREQTLNALLVEMDGFDAKSGVIILAATNRPEVLDAALLRSGRFDRQVVVDRPDKKGRTHILQVHTRSVLVASGVDLELVAAQTPGFVGADLANIVNEAALLAARKEKHAVELEDFQDAIERVIAGLEKKSRRLNQKEQNIVAYHESGHAIVAGALAEADPVHKISIVSRGIGALGYTLQLPIEDRYLVTRSELYDKICMLLGGRAAECVVFGDVSSGASNDLQRVTDIARRMVAEYGMNERVGNLSYGDDSNTYLKSMGMSSRQYSDHTAEIIDHEVEQLVARLFKKTLAILEKNLDLLHEMASRLKEDEVLEGDALMTLMSRVVALSESESTNANGRSERAIYTEPDASSGH